MGETPDLDTDEDSLGHLADDLGAMRDHLGSQAARMNSIVDTIRAGWDSDAGSGYRTMQRGVAEDVVRIRDMLGVIEEAVRFSRNGFSEQELATLRRMRQEQSRVDVAAEAAKLMGPPESGAPARPPSRILDV